MSFPASPEFTFRPERPIDLVTDKYIGSRMLARERGFRHEETAAYAQIQFQDTLNNYAAAGDPNAPIEHIVLWLGLQNQYGRSYQGFSMLTQGAAGIRIDEIMKRGMQAPLPQIYRGFKREIETMGKHLAGQANYDHNGQLLRPYTTDLAYYVGIADALNTDWLPADAGTKGQKRELQGIINGETANMANFLLACGKPWLALSFGQHLTAYYSPADESLEGFAVNMANAVKAAPIHEGNALYAATCDVLPRDQSTVGACFANQFAQQ